MAMSKARGWLTKVGKRLRGLSSQANGQSSSPVMYWNGREAMLAETVGGQAGITPGGDEVSAGAEGTWSVCQSLSFAEEREVSGFGEWEHVKIEKIWPIPVREAGMEMVVGPIFIGPVEGSAVRVSYLPGEGGSPGGASGWMSPQGAAAGQIRGDNVYVMDEASGEIRWVRVADLENIHRAIVVLTKTMEEMILHCDFGQGRRRRKGGAQQGSSGDPLRGFNFNNPNRCFQCNAGDHEILNCPELLFNNVGRCFICDSPEHFQESCPQNQGRSTDRDGDSPV